MLYISQRQRTADNFIFRFTSDNKQNNQPALERILKFSEKIIFSSETTASMFVQCMYETDERTDGRMDMSQISMKWSSYFANTISFSLWITCDRYFWYFKDMTTTTTKTIVPDTSSNPPTIDHVHTSDHRLVFVTYSRPTHTAKRRATFQAFRVQTTVRCRITEGICGNRESWERTSDICYFFIKFTKCFNIRYKG